MDEDQVLPDVDQESSGGLPSESLDNGRGDAMFSKGGCSPSLHRLTSDRGVEEKVQLRSEEGMGGHISALS